MDPLINLGLVFMVTGALIGFVVGITVKCGVQGQGHELPLEVMVQRESKQDPYRLADCYTEEELDAIVAAILRNSGYGIQDLDKS